MITFLFWNVNRKPLESNIASIARNFDVDFLLFVEFEIEPSIMLSSLNSFGKADYFYIPKIGCDKVEIFSRFPDRFIKTRYEESDGM